MWRSRKLDKEAWRARLVDYIALGDRDSEPLFVGRDAGLRAVATNLAAVRSGKTKGRTMVFSGAPGAGKTAFIGQLELRAENKSLTTVYGSPAPLFNVVHVSPKEFRADVIVRKVVLALTGKLPRRVEHVSRIQGKGSIGVAKGSRESTWTTSSTVDMATPDGTFPWEPLRELAGNALRKRCVILAVDEAQNLTGTRGDQSGHNLPLHDLHTGDPERSPNRKLPIFGLFAGLSDTVQKLEQRGVSRLTDGLSNPMPPLSQAECEAYARGMLDYLATVGTAAQRKALANWLAKSCGGWPHHLRTHMQALAKAMLAQDSPELAELDGELVHRDIARGRNLYYAHRLGNLTPWREAVAAVIDRCCDEGIWLDEIDDAADDAIRHAIKSRPRLADIAMTAESLRDTMMHSGLLHPVDGTGLRFTCPIASMRDWLDTRVHKPKPMPSMKPA